MDNQQTILIVAHNHPECFAGGAERVAYDLFLAYKEQPNITPYFLAATTEKDRPYHIGTALQSWMGRDDEYIFCGDAFDYFLQSQLNKHFLTHDFVGLLKSLKPDVVHFHHTMRIGIEAIALVKATLPTAKIVYTLHEFIFMCHHNGQMVTTSNHTLCHRPSPSNCHQCFSDISPAQFKTRELFIKSHLNHVDAFISPSQFLADRFVQWGIEAQKMHVVENGQAVVESAPARKLKSRDDSRDVFAYFGQINPYKGVNLLLDAMEHLKTQYNSKIQLILFGSIEQQSDEFKQAFAARIEELKGQVVFWGSYQKAELAQCMAKTDWVIVPSTWWENSPLVIQEALAHKRPVICSNIGGMAEKVDHNKTGLHFSCANAMDLAKVMHEASTKLSTWDGLVKQIPPRFSQTDAVNAHMNIYQLVEDL